MKYFAIEKKLIGEGFKPSAVRATLARIGTRHPTLSASRRERNARQSLQSAARMARMADRRAGMGLKKIALWVAPKHAELVRKIALKLGNNEMNIEYLSKDRGYGGETTTYWFELSGTDVGTGVELDGAYGICNKNGEIIAVVDGDGTPLTSGDVETIAVLRHAVITDEMRRGD